MEKHEQAELDYVSGMKYKDIAEKYEVSLNTVKSWKKRHKWSREPVKSVHTKKEGAGAPEKSESEEENTEKELNEKQHLFCLYYVKSFNAAKAYQKAYGCSYATAATNGPALLRNTQIRNSIELLKQSRLNRKLLSEDDIFQKYMDIAFSDITDYVSFGQEEVQVTAMYGPVYEKDEKTGVTKIINTVRFKQSEEVDGSLIQEVSSGKDGAKIKLADRMKALNWLADHMDLATEEQKARIDQLKANTAKIKGEDTEETVTDDGFVEALNATAREDWSDEED